MSYFDRYALKLPVGGGEDRRMDESGPIMNPTGWECTLEALGLSSEDFKAPPIDSTIGFFESSTPPQHENSSGKRETKTTSSPYSCPPTEPPKVSGSFFQQTSTSPHDDEVNDNSGLNAEHNRDRPGMEDEPDYWITNKTYIATSDASNPTSSQLPNRSENQPQKQSRVPCGSKRKAAASYLEQLETKRPRTSSPSCQDQSQSESLGWISGGKGERKTVSSSTPTLKPTNSTLKPAYQADKNALTIKLSFKLSKRKKDGRYNTNQVTQAIIIELCKQKFGKAYELMQKYNRTKNDEPKKISSKIALGFFLMIPRIKPAPNQDVIVEYYSFRTCFRAVLRKYYKLTGKETNPTELMPAPDENKNEFYEVDAELEGKTITVRRVSNAPNHDAPHTNPKRKEPPPPPNSPQILTHKSCLPREKHRAKKQRIKPTVNSDPTGVAVVLELNLTPLPDIDEQDDLDDWTHQDKQRTKKKLIEMLDLKDIKANLGDQAQKPTIKFKNYIKQSFKNWENRKNNAEGNRKITVAFKFPNENFFKDESQDFQRCEKLLKYCEGILDKHGFRRSRGRTIQGSIICTFHVASSSLPRLAELRGEILDDFKNLLDEGKIKCMPTMSTTTPTSTSTKKDDEKNRSDVRKHFASRTTYVRIEATYIVAFYIINKLLDLKDWSAPTFCIRSIQAFPIHPHPFTNEDLQRLGDCLPVIKMLIQTLQIFLKADLVPCILALIVEYWAFDAIPPPKGIHERPSLASRLTDHNQAPAVEADAKKIFEAVQEGSLEVVKDIMPKPEHHLRCNTKLVDGKGRTPLHLACEHGQTSIAGHLLDLKATVNALDNNDQTPLLIACRKKNLQIVRLLLDSKANIECSTKEYGRTPLLDACSKGHLPIVQCLVEVRANVKATDHYGDGPIHLATGRRDVSMIKYLVENAEPNIDAVNKIGDGPLHIATEMEDLATVKYLVENAKANIKAVNKYGRTSLHIACRKKNLKIVQLLLNVEPNVASSPDKFGRTPLMVACRAVHLPAVQNLVEAKADVKAINSDGDGLLHLAAESRDMSMTRYLVKKTQANINAVNNEDRTPLSIAYLNGDSLMMKLLIDSKANPEISKTSFVDGPLHVAVRRGNLEAMKYLVEKAKANVKSVNKEGDGPLHIAVRYGNLDTVQYLVEKAKANVKSVNKQGDEPLHIAVRRGNLEAIQYLVEKAKANVKSVNKQGDGPLHIAVQSRRKKNSGIVQYLVEAKADIKAVNKQGDEPLHIAVRQGNLETIQYLVEKAKANAKSVNKQGDGPLHIAAQSRLYAASEMVQYLVEAKADIKALNKEGDGPLHIAARHGNLKVMQYLVEEAKANVKSVNKHGQSPLAIAQAEMSFRDMMGQSPLAIAQAEMSFRDMMASYWKWKDIVRYLEEASSALNAEGQTDEKDEEHHQENIERLKNELAKKAKDQDKNLIKKLEQAVRKHSPHMSQLKHEDKEVQL